MVLMQHTYRRCRSAHVPLFYAATAPTGVQSKDAKSKSSQDVSDTPYGGPQR